MSLKLPNDKIVYNLPEQVGVNAENIKYLAEVYKDIDSIPAQFAEIKTYYEDTMVPAFNGWTSEMEGFEADMATWAGQINTWATNIGASAAAGITGYAITPLTVSQTQANFIQAFNFATGTGLQITNAYNRCEVINNILYLICNIKVKNISGAAKKIGGAWQDPAYCSFTLPTSIASNIYDIDGISAHDSTATNQKIITSTHVTCLSGSVSASAATTYNDFRFDFTNRKVENGVSCYFRSNQIVELAIDEEIVLMARIALTLI